MAANDTNVSGNLGSSPLLQRRENLTKGSTFTKGATVGTTGVNTKQDTRPNSQVRSSFNRSRSVRGAKRVFYNNEGHPTIGVNSTPERAPSVS